MEGEDVRGIEWWETEEAEPYGRLCGEKDPALHTSPPPAHSLAGIGAAPRLRRRFHWPKPHLDPPRTPLISSTLSALPLPLPPLRVLLHAPSTTILRSYPEEFQ